VFLCEEKRFPGHKCSAQVYQLQVIEEEGSQEKEGAEEREEEREEVDSGVQEETL